MSEPRICPECGSDIYRASHYEDLMLARDRFHRETQKQALQILALRLEVGTLKDERRYRGRKVEMQRRTIRRLQEKVKKLGGAPHDDKPLGEGDPASPSPEHELAVGSNLYEEFRDRDYPNARGLRKMRKKAKELKAKKEKKS